MAFFKSMSEEGSRRIFLTFFALSTLLPLLIIIFIIYEYILPIIAVEESSLLQTLLMYGLAAMVIFPLLGLSLMYRWIHSLESVTRVIHSKSAEVIKRGGDFSQPSIDAETVMEGAATAATDGTGEVNEIRSLVESFNAIFQTAADQLAEREHLKELLASLIAVASDLTSELEFNRLFPLIISRVTAAMEAERTSFYVIDWDTRELWTKVSEGIDAIRLPLGRGISGRVAETGEGINVADAWELPYFDRSFDLKNNYRTRSVLCVPIRSRTGQNIGVLQAINKRGRDHFDRGDEVFMKGLASQVGIALENSLLIDEIKLSFSSSISTLAAVVDARHPLTAGHSRRVTEYALLIAKEMNVEGNECEALRLASLLHDIGKIGIRDAVLLKEGIFTPEERAEMNNHPATTRLILEKFHFPRSLQSVPTVACHHHERADGSGYPEGLAGDQLPLGSKIIAVADVFDALTSRREYPKYTKQTTMDTGPMPLATVVSLMRQESGTHFAPEVVSAFLQCLPRCLLLYRGEHFTPEYVDDTIRHLAPELLPESAGERFRGGSPVAASESSKQA